MMESKGQWVKLKGLPRQNFGVLNVYDQNNPTKRIQLWDYIKNLLLRDC